MKNSGGKIILALETGLDGGSVAILRDGEVLDSVTGESGVSKSEDSLLLIEHILTRNGLAKREVGLLKFCVEPGSLTGRRIGAATAKGLSAALGVRVVEVSLFEAMIRQCCAEGHLLAGWMTAKREVFRVEYSTGKGIRRFILGKIQSAKLDEFAEELREILIEYPQMILNENFFNELKKKNLQAFTDKNEAFSVIKGIPAEIIGLSI